MSRHSVNISHDGKTYNLVMGYDRPINEQFWQLFDQESELLSCSNFGQVVLEDELTSMGIPVAPLFEQLEPIFEKVDMEYLEGSFGSTKDFNINEQYPAIAL